MPFLLLWSDPYTTSALLSSIPTHMSILCLLQVLLPTYNILDGAQPLLELHKIGKNLVGTRGVQLMLPCESCPINVHIDTQRLGIPQWTAGLCVSFMYVSKHCSYQFLSLRIGIVVCSQCRSFSNNCKIRITSENGCWYKEIYIYILIRSGSPSLPNEILPLNIQILNIRRNERKKNGSATKPTRVYLAILHVQQILL